MELQYKKNPVEHKACTVNDLLVWGITQLVIAPSPERLS